MCEHLYVRESMCVCERVCVYVYMHMCVSMCACVFLFMYVWIQGLFIGLEIFDWFRLAGQGALSIHLPVSVSLALEL